MRHRLQGSIVLSAAAVALALLGCEQHSSPVGPTPVECSLTISPATHEFSSESGTGDVTVTTSDPSCTWNAAASATWIAILENATGTGPGTVKYTVAANEATAAREGTLTIGGQVHAISQQGRALPACSYDISPANASFDSDGGSGTIVVTARADCGWTATSTTVWLRVTAGGNGSGNGTVSYSVDPNPDTADRGASVLVAGKTFAVKQAGEELVCEYSVAPVQFSPCMRAGAVNATIVTQESCRWTASPTVPWLSLPGGDSGRGPAEIVIAFTANYDAPREGIVEVRWPAPTAGQNVRVSQAGCYYAVSPNAFSFSASGGAGSFDVFQQSEPNICGGALQDACLWTAQSDVPWIAVTSSMPRFGDNPVAFTVGPNESTAPRTGRIVVRDKVVQITQTGR